MDSQFDYGAIILPNDQLGNFVGWFELEVVDDAGLNGLLVNLSGYPGDKHLGTQWFMGGSVTSVEEKRILYMVELIGGQSGSPVWRLRDGQQNAVGIHYGGCPNGATRITQDLFNNMLEWRT